MAQGKMTLNSDQYHEKNKIMGSYPNIFFKMMQAGEIHFL